MMLVTRMLLLLLACVSVPPEDEPEKTGRVSTSTVTDTPPTRPGDTSTDDTSTDDTSTDDTSTSPPKTDPVWDLAPWLGLNANAPLDVTTGALADTVSDPTLLASSGAGWVRLNFMLGPYDSPEDPAWEAAFRTIVDGLTGQGLQVYGLIGAESVSSAAEVGSDAWLDDYAYNFVAIVDRFKDTVRVWESFNEPNNWVADSTPALSPERFSLLLERVYLETKHYNGHAGDPDWQVTLVSGPLFTHDLDNGATYLSDTWWYGRNTGAWDWVHANTGGYPLDGVGAHLYVAQGDTTPGPIAAGIEANLAAMQAVIDEEDPGKRLYLSEVGWSSDYVGEAGQADATGHALSVLRDDPRVALTAWFTVADWPGAAWGLRWDVATPKLGWESFVDEASR